MDMITRSLAAFAPVARFVSQERGQDLMEYGLLASLIATFLIGATGALGDQVNSLWQVIAEIQYTR
jgi:Flp pilus assembly pilin Flp